MRHDRADAQRPRYGSEGWGFESLRARCLMSRDIGKARTLIRVRVSCFSGVRRGVTGRRLVCRCRGSGVRGTALGDAVETASFRRSPAARVAIPRVVVKPDEREVDAYLRRGELLGLGWSAVDLKKGTVRIGPRPCRAATSKHRGQPRDMKGTMQCMVVFAPASGCVSFRRPRRNATRPRSRMIAGGGFGVTALHARSAMRACQPDPALWGNRRDATARGTRR